MIYPLNLLFVFLLLFAVRYFLSIHYCYPSIFLKAQSNYNIIVFEVSSLHSSEISSNKHAYLKWITNTAQLTKINKSHRKKPTKILSIIETNKNSCWSVYVIFKTDTNFAIFNSEQAPKGEFFKIHYID